MITEWQMKRDLALIMFQDMFGESEQSKEYFREAWKLYESAVWEGRLRDDEEEYEAFRAGLSQHIEKQKDKRQSVRITAAEGFIAGWRAAKGGAI